MTTRTTRSFICTNGHTGEEKSSENDQPYSQQWEYTTITNLVEGSADSKGYTTYTCKTCGELMSEVKK